ncbi:MAG: DNA-3-methyladenine glycosylase I [Candidatus Neomarinimicrobiota bacterium]|nr:MAG: DNA-3-methyladenine glycosylase I [Candidatus Neomarinimicrobiota bacterium]
MKRCAWVGEDPLMIRYHDEEWGVPVHDDRRLFEYLILDGFQAGLSWRIVLHKREALREALDGFDPEKIAAYDEEDVESRMSNPGIIRNRQKLRAAVRNARAYLSFREKHGSLAAFLWDIHGPVRKNAFTREEEIPATTPAAERISRVLKRAGFSFVGPTITYALLQAAGFVNDHLVSCFRYSEV